MSQNKRIISGFYKFRRTSRRNSIYSLVEYKEIVETALRGNPINKIKFKPNSNDWLHKGKTRLYDIIIKDEGIIGRAFLPKDCKGYGYGFLMVPRVNLILHLYPGKRILEIFTSDKIEIDHHLLYNKFELKELEKEMNSIKELSKELK